MYLGSASAMLVLPYFSARLGSASLLKIVGGLGLAWMCLWLAVGRDIPHRETVIPLSTMDKPGTRELVRSVGEFKSKPEGSGEGREGKGRGRAGGGERTRLAWRTGAMWRGMAMELRRIWCPTVPGHNFTSNLINVTPYPLHQATVTATATPRAGPAPRPTSA